MDPGELPIGARCPLNNRRRLTLNVLCIVLAIVEDYFEHPVGAVRELFARWRGVLLPYLMRLR